MSHWRNRQPISAPTYDDAVPPPGYIPGYGRGAVGFGTRASSGVVPGYQYTKEDDEADAIFNQIDALDPLIYGKITKLMSFFSAQYNV